MQGSLSVADTGLPSLASVTAGVLVEVGTMGVVVEVGTAGVLVEVGTMGVVVEVGTMGVLVGAARFNNSGNLQPAVVASRLVARTQPLSNIVFGELPLK